MVSLVVANTKVRYTNKMKPLMMDVHINVNVLTLQEDIIHVRINVFLGNYRQYVPLIHQHQENAARLRIVQLVTLSLTHPVMWKNKSHIRVLLHAHYISFLILITSFETNVNNKYIQP